jgi:hypothetical protein
MSSHRNIAVVGKENACGMRTNEEEHKRDDAVM